MEKRGPVENIDKSQHFELCVMKGYLLIMLGLRKYVDVGDTVDASVMKEA